MGAGRDRGDEGASNRRDSGLGKFWQPDGRPEARATEEGGRRRATGEGNRETEGIEGVRSLWVGR